MSRPNPGQNQKGKISLSTTFDHICLVQDKFNLCKYSLDIIYLQNSPLYRPSKENDIENVVVGVDNYKVVNIGLLIEIFNCYCTSLHTQTHTNIYIYIYIYIKQLTISWSQFEEVS